MTIRPKRIGQKRVMDKEIVETIPLRGLLNFDKFKILNPSEIKIGEDKILN